MAKDTAHASADANRSPQHLWQVPLFLLGVTAVVLMGVFRPFRDETGHRQLDRDLGHVREALDEKRPHPAELAPRAEDALARSEMYCRRTGEAHFLLGTIYLRLAGSTPPPQAAETWQKAKFHLEQAEVLGVAEADQPRLCQRLGVALHHTNEQPQRVLDYLRRSPEAADDPGELYALLTQTHLRLPVPDLQAALAANQKLLALPTSDDNILAPARLLRGELLLQLKENAEARKVLERIGLAAPPAIRARARLLVAQTYQDEGAWDKAAELWQQILAESSPSPPEVGRIWYALGLCYRQTDRGAEADRAWETALAAGGDVTQAAALRLAELRLEGDKRATSLDLYERALQNIKQPQDWRNRFVVIAEVRPLIEAGCRVHREAGDHAKAVRLASLFEQVAVAPAGQIALGEAMQAWADSLNQNGKGDVAHVRFREAAVLFESVAAARLGQPDHAEWLWRCGRCWSLGHEHARTISVLERFVKLLAPPERLGEAWYRLAAAHHHQGNAAAAETAWKQCILWPGPYAFQAPYQLAAVQTAKGNVDDAIDILEQNLRRMEPATMGEAHERSLFAVAGLYFQRGKFKQAAERYDKALQRYPANAGALIARYHLAECFRHLATLEYQNISSSSWPLQEAQQLYRQEYRMHLQKAAANYRKAADLAGGEKEGRLNPTEAMILLRSRFAVADCEFSLDHYDKAAPLYDALARQHADRVEGLIALKQLWRCHGLAGRIDQARATLVLLSKALTDLPETAFRGRPEAESRLEFKRWLDWAVDQLPKAEGKETSEAERGGYFASSP